MHSTSATNLQQQLNAVTGERDDLRNQLESMQHQLANVSALNNVKSVPADSPAVQSEEWQEIDQNNMVQQEPVEVIQSSLLDGPGSSALDMPLQMADSRQQQSHEQV